MKKFQPSVDQAGRILFAPSHASFRPLHQHACLGQRVRVITCLNTSETVSMQRPDGRRYKKLLTRVYSLRKTKLLGHASRFCLTNVRAVYDPKGYENVIRNFSKKPHAWLEGTISEVLANDDAQRHHTLMAAPIDQYIAYDPYKTRYFRFCEQPFLPDKTQTQALNALYPESSPVPKLYFYESGIRVVGDT
ncbi:MAG: hypothetical protein C9356_14975 [Oleiphilus sp.]|nr:MAG: hypothetical protein C9356_14975 [Oleiphilus sp.]